MEDLHKAASTRSRTTPIAPAGYQGTWDVVMEHASEFDVGDLSTRTVWIITGLDPYQMFLNFLSNACTDRTKAMWTGDRSSFSS
jgi:hypothetical protein